MYSYPLDPLQIARTLVSIPSESSNPIGNYKKTKKGERAVMEYLHSLAHSYEIDAILDPVVEDRPNLYLRIPRASRPKIFFDSHMDTVSAANMVVPPFQGVVEDGILWGRGACDSKAGAAALMTVLLEGQQKKKVFRYDITVAFTIDEENGFEGAKRVRESLPPFDFGIVFEPTNFQLVTSHKGVLRCKITTRGLAVHSSIPSRGENAILKMVAILKKLDDASIQLERESDAFLGAPTLSVNMINGGVAFNIVPDQCSIEVDLRLLPERSLESMITWLKELVEPDGELEVLLHAPGFRNSQETEFQTHFKQVHQEAGIGCKEIGTAFATDCAIISDMGPCVIWGPGDIKNAHTRDEHIAVDELYTATDILRNFLFET